MGDLLKSAIDILGINKTEDEESFIGATIEVNGTILKVKKFLAAGGFSNVYLASNVKDELFAVKKLIGFDKDGCEKILQEITLHKRLSHENIIKLIGVSYAQKNLGTSKFAEYSLLSDYCPHSLVNIINEELSISTTLAIMNQATDAVNYLHNLFPSIIHRDIKLENYLISTDGILKLCDFGSATTVVVQITEDWDMQKRNSLQEEIFCNTSPFYRAPEIVDTWNNYEIGLKVDIWALGCVFFCVLYKKHPFGDGAKLSIINGNFEIPKIVQKACFESLLKNCLTVSPNKRINSGEIIKELQSIGHINGYSKKNTNLIQECIQQTSASDLLENQNDVKIQKNHKQQNMIDEEKQNIEDNFGLFLNSNGLFSSIKDGANTLLKNFIGTSSRVLSSMHNVKSNNIFNLTSRIIVSFQPNIEVLQKYLEGSYSPSNISVYNFSSNNSRLPPPIRTLEINQFNNICNAKVFDLEHLYYLIEEMFGFLSSGDNYILIMQDNKYSNITAVLVCALFLYAGLSPVIEDSLQIFNVKVHRISLFPSELRYLNYIKKIVMGNVPHNGKFKFLTLSFQNTEASHNLIGNWEILTEIFENNRLVFSKNQMNTNLSTFEEIKINKDVKGNILIAITLSKNGNNFAEKPSKIKVGKIQFHTGFLCNSKRNLKFSKDEVDLENDIDLNFIICIKYCIEKEKNVFSTQWGNTQLKKDPTKLFGSLYEYNEVLENFIGIRNTENLNSNVELRDKFNVNGNNFGDNIIAVESKTCEDLKTLDNTNVPVLLDLSMDNSENFVNAGNESNKNISPETNISPQLLDIFEQSEENILSDTIQNEPAKEHSDNLSLDFLGLSLNNPEPLKNLKSTSSSKKNVSNEPVKIKIDGNNSSVDFLGLSLDNSASLKDLNIKSNIQTNYSEKCDTIQNKPVKIDDNSSIDFLGLSLNNSHSIKNLNIQSNPQNTSSRVNPERKEINKKTEQYQKSSDFSQFKFNNKSNIFEPIEKTPLQPKTDVFADLLGEQGYSFGKKNPSEPKTINDLRNKEIIGSMDEESIKIFKWTDGKRANIRALLCSMDTVLWEGAKWTKCEMHQLITLVEVKKAYRQACLAVHPDKHIGTENEHLSKLIFMELNTAWNTFNS